MLPQNLIFGSTSFLSGGDWAALALLVEHFLLGRYGKPWSYALGLPTAMGGMVAWALWRGLLVDWVVAAAMLAGACAAGAPVGILILVERKRERERWEALRRLNQEYAAQLALQRQMGSREWRRLRDLAETLSFSLGAAQREMEMLAVWQEQAEPLLGPILEVLKGGGEE